MDPESAFQHGFGELEESIVWRWGGPVMVEELQNPMGAMKQAGTVRKTKAEKTL